MKRSIATLSFEKLLLVVVICFAAVFYLRQDALNLPYFPDEMRYLLSGRVGSLIQLLDHFFGWKLTALRVSGYLITAFYVAGTYFMSRMFAGFWVSAFTSLALLCSPVILSISGMVQPDLIMADFAIWSFLALISEKRKTAAFLLALGVWPKPMLLILTPAYLFALFRSDTRPMKHKIKSAAIFIAPAVMIAIISWIYFARTHQTIEIPLAFGSFQLWAKRLGYRVAQIFFADGRFALTFAILGATFFKFWKNRKTVFPPSLLAFFLFLVIETFFLSVIGYLHQRYFVVILPFLFVLGAEAFESLAQGWLSAAAMAILALLGLATWHDTPSRFSEFQYRSSYRDYVKLMQEVSNRVKDGKTKIYAHWPLNQLLSDPGFGYVEKGVEVSEPDTSVGKGIVILLPSEEPPGKFKNCEVKTVGSFSAQLCEL